MIQAIAVIGPTAVGKTEYAIQVAMKYGGEIISADSMQVYSGLDIGTAKPTPEELNKARHHMIGVIDPAADFSVVQYRKMAMTAIEKVSGAGKVPVIAGGSGLYINALIYDMGFEGPGQDDALRAKYEQLADDFGNDYIYDILKKADSAAASRIHPNNRKRVIRALERLENPDEPNPVEEDKNSKKQLLGFEDAFRKSTVIDPVVLLLTRDRDELYRRIETRTDAMFEAGLVEEVASLVDSGLSAAHISMLGIGYKEVLRYLAGEYDRNTAIELVKRNSRRYAKRQLTWFKRIKEAHEINLSALDEPENALRLIYGIIDAKRNSHT